MIQTGHWNWTKLSTLSKINKELKKIMDGKNTERSNQNSNDQSYKTCDDATDQTTLVSRDNKKFNSVDELLDALGGPGRYSIILCCVLTLNMFTIAPNQAAGVFIGHTPSHHCHPPVPYDKLQDLLTSSNQAINRLGNAEGNKTIRMISNTTSINNGTIKEWDDVTYKECQAVWHIGGQQTVRHCKGAHWRYDIAQDESSSVTEWNLVCDRAPFANLATTFYYIGVMAGGIIFGYVSDVFGRKVALLTSLYMTVAFGLLIFFTRNLVAFFILRTLIGVAIQGLQTSTYIRLVEMFTPKIRTLAVTVHTVFWAVALIGLGLAAWIVKDWRYIQLMVIGQAIFGGLYMWLIPESLRWSISQKRGKQVRLLVKRISKFNGRPIDPTSLDTLLPRNTLPATHVAITNEEGDKKEETPRERPNKDNVSYLDLVRTPQLRKRTFLMCYITFSTNVGYWGLAYSSASIVGNKYLNFTLGSVAEAVMSVVNVFIIRRFGKKKALFSYFLFGGLCCFVLCGCLAGSGSITVNVITIVSTLGRLTTAGLFVANDLYMAELFPTVVRNMGMGVCTFMGRLGAVCTPMIFTLGVITFKAFPLVVFGIVTVAASLVTLLLPETDKFGLPETLDDVNAPKVQIRQVSKDKTQKDAIPSTDSTNEKTDLVIQIAGREDFMDEKVIGIVLVDNNIQNDQNGHSCV